MNDEVIIASAVFDVPADNYEEFDQEIDPEKLGARLIQKNSLKGTVRAYQHYAKNHLLLSFKEKKFQVNLSWLSSEPEHYKIIVWKWLYMALAATALAGLSLYLDLSKTVAPEYCLLSGIIAVTAALICLLIFIYLMRDDFIFKSRYGDARLFLIENRKPGQDEFDHFFIQLQQAIDKAQAEIPVSDRLVGELKMCRRLRDEGIINDQSYTVARTAIFKHDQYKS